MKLVHKRKGYTELRIPPYRMRVFVTTTGQPLPADFAHLEELEEDNNGYRGLCATLSSDNGVESILLILPKKYEHSVTMHEAIHAAHRMLMSRGVEFDGDNDEAVTYLTEFIVEMIRRGHYKLKGDPFYG